MSTIVIGKFTASAEKMKAMFASRKDDLVAVHDEAVQHGGKHHRFAAGENGEIVFIDEWESREAFDGFFRSQTKIPELMQEVGASGPPQFTFYEALSSPDEF